MGIKQMGVTLRSALAALLLLPLASVWGWRPAILAGNSILLLTGMFTYIMYDEPRQKTNPTAAAVKRNPMTCWTPLRHKALVYVSLSALILSGTQMIVNTYLVLFSYERLGISLFLSGTLLVLSEAGGSVGRICWGVISDRFFNSKRLMVLFHHCRDGCRHFNDCRPASGGDILHCDGARRLFIRVWCFRV
ncbi:MFS transporter [Siminovitchia sp. FSL H7-0308]|uniref:MFS transporter n=1 Tax=Siminovitchia sp. FSL H7-0308 TaxID=2921432 RepID=UPI0030EF66D5